MEEARGLPLVYDAVADNELQPGDHGYWDLLVMSSITRIREAIDVEYQGDIRGKIEALAGLRDAMRAYSQGGGAR